MQTRGQPSATDPAPFACPIRVGILSASSIWSIRCIDPNRASFPRLSRKFGTGKILVGHGHFKMERLKEFFWGVTDREADPLRCGRSTSERAALSVVWGLVSFRPLLLGIVAMARQNWFQKLYWKYLSKPITERALLLHVIENPPSSILEIGMGSGERIQRLLNLIATASDGKPIRYTGVDPFESRSGQQALLTLKGAHRIFTERGIKAHLVPGEPTGALARVAHSVLPSDLILIDGYIGQGDADADAIAQWLPRLCHVQSTIFAAQNAGGVFLPIPRPTNAMPSQLSKAA